MKKKTKGTLLGIAALAAGVLGYLRWRNVKRRYEPVGPIEPGEYELPEPIDIQDPAEPAVTTKLIAEGETAYSRGKVLYKPATGVFWVEVDYLPFEMFESSPAKNKDEAMFKFGQMLNRYGFPKSDNDIPIAPYFNSSTGKHGAVMQSATEGWYYGIWKSPTGFGSVEPAPGQRWGEKQAEEHLLEVMRR